ncbi:MAG TPA: carbohydrate ABC transporter permease [Chloroflexota bacterium]|nr:carbohydrate ABC transporter permease [Chloroflexota bacterium]
MLARRRALHVTLHVLLVLLSTIYVVPFLWMVSTSLKLSGREITFPPQWIPDPVVWGNYYRAVTVVPMFQFLRNTLVVTITATCCGVLTASLAGYAFARLRFPGRDKLFAMCLTALMLPGIVTLIPEFLIFKQLTLLDTLWPLIIPWSLGGSAFAVFLFRQYALTIPLDLDEAARVDGAGAFRIWWSIMLPLARPVLATLAILSVIYHWNEFLRPLVYIHTPSLRTLAIGLALFKSEYLVEWNLMMAAATLMLIPILVLFFVAQRYFVQGIVMTGIKG